MKGDIILIADSGATKSDWCLVKAGKIHKRINTQGINPFHQSEADIMKVLQEELMPNLPEIPSSVFFYGAGCTPEKSVILKALIEQVIPETEAEVHSDLLGAARALCGHSVGIACILGTGTNSCLYDGSLQGAGQILLNTPPLGYILGDEGSGAVMGRNFVADVLKGLMPKAIEQDFYAETGETKASIIENVYRRPLAARYLATFCRFVGNHRDNEAVQGFLHDHFRRFFLRNVQAYGRTDLPVSFVGGIACHFSAELTSVAESLGYRVGRILEKPMEGLVAYHVE